MAATVEILSYHGTAAGTSADIAGATIKYKVADNDTNDANNPIPIPTSGTNYSYIKHFRFSASVAPDNLIDNLKFYTDNDNNMGTGTGLRILLSHAYRDPVAQGTDQQTGTADAFTYNSGTPLAIGGSIGASTGAFGDWMRTQMTVDSTAGQGNTSTEVLTFSYDES